MATGYLTLFDVSGNGLGMASAATSITTENRSLTVGSGTLTAATGTFTNVGGTLSTVSQPNVTTLAGVTTLNNLTIGSGSISGLTTLNKCIGFGGAGASDRCISIAGDLRLAATSNYGAVVSSTLGATSGTAAQCAGLFVYPDYSLNAGTITAAYGLIVGGGATAGTVTTGYGLHVSNPTFGTTKVCAYFEGNVGIGNASPGQKLQVAEGSILCYKTVTTGDLANANQLLLGEQTNNSSWRMRLGYYYQGPPWAGVIQVTDAGAGTYLLLNPSGGYVGVGVTVPVCPMHVKHASAQQNVARLEDINGHGLDIDGWNSGANIDPVTASDNLYFGRDVSWGNVYLQSGNVGVGSTTSINNKFEVEGGVRVRGAIAATASGAGLEFAYSSSNAYIGAIDRAASSYKPLIHYASSYTWQIGGDIQMALITNSLSVPAGVEVNAYATGDSISLVDFHSQAAVDYNARVIRYAGANGIFELYNTGTGDFKITQANAGALVFQTSNSPRMTIDSSGNVGINGTPTSSYRFYASGATHLGDSYDGSVYGIVQITRAASQGSAHHLSFIRSGSQIAGIGFRDNSNIFQVVNAAGSNSATTGLIIDTNGNSCFGSTSTLNNKLEVEGGARFRGDISTTSTGAGVEISYASNVGTIGVHNRALGTTQKDLTITSAALTLNIHNSTTYQIIGSTSGLYPTTDNSISCGKTGNRWTAVWAANGTIQTSDATTKENITATPLGLEFIKKLEPCSFKFKDTTVKVWDGKSVTKEDGSVIDEKVERILEQKHKRRHHGLVAQQVRQVLDDLKISTDDFAGYIDPTVSGEEGPIGLRYDQFIAPLIKAVQELSAKHEALRTEFDNSS